MEIGTGYYYSLVAEFVSKSFNGTKYASDMKHLERTAFWLTQLKPDSDEALLIAAIAHDIDRPLRNEQLYKGIPWASQKYYQIHQQESARIVAEFLKEKQAPPVFIERVRGLIAHHESGGDEEQNLVKDADSISFLENQVRFFIEHMVPKHGIAKIREKLVWMFERITSPQAKAIAKPMFETALKQLENCES